MDIDSIFNFLNSQASTTIAGLFIIVISIIAIYFQRRTAKQKAAIDYLEKLASEARLIEGARFLRDYHFDDEKSIALIATSKDKQTERDKITPILNYFESLSIGVRIGIYDKRTVCLSRKMQIINTFRYSRPYIEKIREKLQNPKLFENLEWLANCLQSPNSKRIICSIIKRLKINP